MTAESLLRLDSVSDYLGPAETRFFGHGFRRATHVVRSVTVESTSDSGVVGCLVDVGYPVDWSRKSVSQDLRPHLSTVDMLVLGVQLSEAHLVCGLGLDDAQRRAAVVRRIELRAGNEPQEDLTGMHGSARLVSTTELEDDPGRSLSVYDCRVGVMRATCHLEHATRTARTGSWRADSLADILGEPHERYYGAGFTTRGQTVETVRVDRSASRASAGLRLLDAEERGAGLDGDQLAGPTLVDGFVAVLQLAQILMYELDSLRREDTNTLWMLRTTIERTGLEPTAVTGPVWAELSAKRLLSLRGGRWRNVDIAGGCAGVDLRASFAHELPSARATG
jgi:avirulence D protein (AvrD)